MEVTWVEPRKFVLQKNRISRHDFSWKRFLIALGTLTLFAAIRMLNETNHKRIPQWPATASLVLLASIVFTVYPALCRMFGQSQVAVSDKGVSARQKALGEWDERFWSWEEIARVVEMEGAVFLIGHDALEIDRFGLPSSFDSKELESAVVAQGREYWRDEDFDDESDGERDA